ncbi:LEAF RUST 10 DISEASE-RESISTANCE LOCUS RECEPTOR-LIKE PROTEIN KINASE-like 1.3 [Cynara cardunculus var. scolymus]|uniref:LEAF RUST 10 DISEASE-RESISTANCE LOCUS RECEPTOR-LIKE PROTEIN KINASE-like 1.3 n=1 Tax=Cynara cardunculus var. scolymus TaxID=59895 RepID=UPI000D62DEBB|nr:LEAF RUST 10 DISEASE-RESISTANCE LOCUS RECEPTOR-LIKE PROTEIN KINASE-like 1.3 [Cynara cardunculus var. scolymus]
MNSQLHSWFPSSLIITVITLLLPIVESQANSSRLHESISQDTCTASFTCKTLSGIQYPFSRREDPIPCGYPGFVLDCNGSNSPTIDINNMTYHVLSIDQSSQILKIVREDVMESICPHDFVNTTIDDQLFDHFSTYTNLTFLYGCPESFNLPGVHLNQFSCDENGIDKVLVLPGEEGPGICKESVIIPVPATAIGSTGLVNSTGLSQVLRGGFEVRWKLDATACSRCTQSGGSCFYNYDTNRTSCACPGSPSITNICTMANTTRASSSPKERSLTIALPIAGGILAAIGIGLGLFVCRQRKKRQAIREDETAENKESVTAVSIKGLATDFPATITSYTSSTTTEFGNSSYFGTRVFNYNELEAATDGFDDSRELGDGGFGTVYYGKLVDGREVAVKRLYENSFKRVEQFMNEVEIITMMDHENLVKFYGCTSRRSRELLLVYEYVANGTVADHLHGKLANSNSVSGHWPNWTLRLNIAIETAEALAYLHESDIIHRDVKTSNILLDKSFRVKVADFGLSRLFPFNATHVSTAPQGTPGYVDPEYYQCYRLTDKSDVYSFGVVLMELLSSLQAVDTSRHRHDINLANMAVDRIQNRRLDELVDRRIGFERDGLVRRMATLVAELGFRCLQHEKDMRPTMREVVENLRGIQKEELNVQKQEVVDIVVDDGSNPPSSGSGATGNLVET